MRKITLGMTGLALAAIHAGCASQPKASAANSKPERDEYIWYAPTGTIISVRIRMSELVARENTKGDQEAMRDAPRRGLHMDRRGDD